MSDLRAEPSLSDPTQAEPPIGNAEAAIAARVVGAVYAWVREDLSVGAKMVVGFHGPALIERLRAACAPVLAPLPEQSPPDRRTNPEGQKL